MSRGRLATLAGLSSVSLVPRHYGAVIVITIEYIGAEPFRVSQMFSLSFKIVNIVECDYFRSHSLSFLFHTA